MKKTVLVVFIVGILVAAGVAAGGQIDQAAFAVTAEKLNQAYSAAMNANDLTAYMTAWDPDGVQMPPDSPMFVGKEAITQNMKGAFTALTFSDFKINMQEAVQFAPTWGYVRGTYSYSFIPRAGGSKSTYDGKFSTVWKKQANGAWKIYRDCFNSNVPKP